MVKRSFSLYPFFSSSRWKESFHSVTNHYRIPNVLLTYSRSSSLKKRDIRGKNVTNVSVHLTWNHCITKISKKLFHTIPKWELMVYFTVFLLFCHKVEVCHNLHNNRISLKCATLRTLRIECRLKKTSIQEVQMWGNLNVKKYSIF